MFYWSNSPVASSQTEPKFQWLIMSRLDQWFCTRRSWGQESAFLSRLQWSLPSLDFQGIRGKVLRVSQHLVTNSNFISRFFFQLNRNPAIYNAYVPIDIIAAISWHFTTPVGLYRSQYNCVLSAIITKVCQPFLGFICCHFQSIITAQFISLKFLC